MLKSLELRFTETGLMTLTTKGTTILVGPNNAGKSLLLREIEEAFNQNAAPTNFKILVNYDIKWPTARDVIRKIAEARASKYPIPIQHSDHINFGRFTPGGGREMSVVSEQMVLEALETKTNKYWFANTFLKWGIIRLDGRSRFNLTSDQGAGDLLSGPPNMLAYFFQNDSARLKVRSLIKDAFDLYFVIDPTNLGQLRIRLSEVPPPKDEQSLSNKARKFHSKAIHIKDASDGVQAFTGIVSAVSSSEFHTILIDEPEAFLHPPLARKLGKNLTTLAAQGDASLMAATHSADFLMGCIQASSSVQVVRLEYSGGKSRGRQIDPKRLDAFLRHPLMRSSNIVSALFHDGVVVTESDNDRVFYAEIYHRILVENSDYPSILFVNAQNKQTIKEMVGPLRQFGVPAAGVSDIDFVKDGGKTFIDWLKAAQIPEALHVGYAQIRNGINDALNKTGKNMKTDGGVAVLEEKDRRAAEDFFDNLSKYGIFVVRRGEVESWLPSLAICGKKTEWAVAMLDRLGSDSAAAAYVKPQSGDVWEFLETIVRWIRNPSRSGVN